MAVSESGAIIGRLVASGVSRAAIGDALGRDRSLISQVARGIKPGNNLRDSLAALERKLAAAPVSKAEASKAARSAPVPTPARRTSKAGALARVRRPTTVRFAHSATANVKRQAARNGAHALQHTLSDAGAEGKRAAVTVSFDSSVSVSRAYGKSGRAGAGGAVELDLGDPDEALATVQDEYGGNVAAYLLDLAAEQGFISDAGHAAGHVNAIELRTF